MQRQLSLRNEQTSSILKAAETQKIRKMVLGLDSVKSNKGKKKAILLEKKITDDISGKNTNTKGLIQLKGSKESVNSKESMRSKESNKSKKSTTSKVSEKSKESMTSKISEKSNESESSKKIERRKPRVVVSELRGSDETLASQYDTPYTEDKDPSTSKEKGS